IGMRHDRVELMVHGEGIAALAPRLSHPGVTITAVERVDNPNYLFVTVHVAGDARPGGVDIEFLDGGEVLARPPWRPDEREPGPGDAIYLVTPDRFANGNPGNDSVPGMREAADRSAPDGRHGGDIAGIRRHLDYIAGMGFTQVWSTPLLENNQPATSYHGYAIT